MKSEGKKGQNYAIIVAGIYELRHEYVGKIGLFVKEWLYED